MIEAQDRSVKDNSSGKRPGLIDVLFNNEPIAKIARARHSSAVDQFGARMVNACVDALDALRRNALAFERYQRQRAQASLPANFHPQSWTRTNGERRVEA